MLFYVRGDCQPLQVRGTAAGIKQQQTTVPEMSSQDTWWSARRLGHYKVHQTDVLRRCNRDLTPVGVQDLDGLARFTFGNRWQDRVTTDLAVLVYGVFMHLTFILKVRHYCGNPFQVRLRHQIEGANVSQNSSFFFTLYRQEECKAPLVSDFKDSRPVSTTRTSNQRSSALDGVLLRCTPVTEPVKEKQW